MNAAAGKLTAIFILAWLWFISCPQSAEAVEIPILQARVNDYAAMLSPATEQQLESVLAALEAEESTQLVVLTIHSLGDANLEEFSLRVAESWQIGQKGLDNGALLLIARDDRKLRIEVGYGLEGSLTDLTAGRIIRDVITPNFRNGNFDQGVIDGVSAIIAAVRGEFSEQVVVATGKQPNNDTGGLGVLLLFALFNIGKVFGGNRMLSGGIGAAVFPVIGALFFGFHSLLLLALIPAGFLAGFLASLVLGSTGGSSGRRSGRYGHSSGGFGGGFGRGGGFGGGGGGFGGGGSSGGW